MKKEQEHTQNVRQINTMKLMREGVNNADANTLAYYLQSKHPEQEVKSVSIDLIKEGNKYGIELESGDYIEKIIRFGLPLVE